MVPLFKHASARCFDCASLAQHDKRTKWCHSEHFIPCHSEHFYFTVIPSVAEESRGNESFLIPRGKVLLLFKRCAARVSFFHSHPVIPSVAEESRGNEFFLIPRGKVLLLFRFCSARVKWCRYSSTLPRDVSTALRLLNMTKEQNGVIPNILFPVIPRILFYCHSERSRGISWKRIRKTILPALLSPMWRREVARQRRREDCCLIICKSFLIRINANYKTSILYRPSAVASCHFPRLLGKARPYYLIVPLLNQRFREMKGRRFACST